MKKIIAIFALALSACAAETMSDVEVSSGNYVWNNSVGDCAYLTLGDTNSYTWDQKCDGSTDYTATSVSVTGNVLRVDAATMIIERASDTQFSGPWTLFDETTPAVFVKQ